MVCQIPPRPGMAVKFLMIAAMLAIGLPTPAQTPVTGSPDEKAPRYDVVSIKPHPIGDGNMSLGPTRNGYAAVNIGIPLLIRDAYNLAKLDQISGLPGWALDARFDVEAKMDEATTVAFKQLSHEQQWRQRQRMLQEMLAERFNLRVHHEAKIASVYALVVAKGGSKLKRSQASDGWWNWSGPQITLQAESMSIFAMCLSKLPDVDRMVVDQTGLAGDYNLTVKWTPADEQARPDADAHIFTALEEQLGLKLVSAKGPVDVIVGDHIDRPSEN